MYNIIIIKAKWDRQIKVHHYFFKYGPWYYFYDSVESKNMWIIQNPRYTATFPDKILAVISILPINTVGINIFLSINRTNEKWEIPKLFIA